VLGVSIQGCVGVDKNLPCNLPMAEK